MWKITSNTKTFNRPRLIMLSSFLFLVFIHFITYFRYTRMATRRKRACKPTSGRWRKGARRYQPHLCQPPTTRSYEINKNINNIIPIISTSRNTKGVIQLNPICGKSQLHSSITFTMVSTISRPPNRIRSVTGIP